jgi:uncharacterized protein (TIGR03083 family)
MGIWDMIDSERNQLAERLNGLSDGEWATETLCSGWDVKSALAHLVTLSTMSAGKFFGGMLSNGLKFEKFQEAGIKANAEGKSGAEVLAAFKAVAGARGKPPGPTQTVLGEVLVHGEDMTKALTGSFGSHAIENVVAVADFYKKSNLILGTKRRIRGVTLRMTDSDWSWGSGPEVAGPSTALLMAMVGRQQAHADLSGEGLSILAGRS